MAGSSEKEKCLNFNPTIHNVDYLVVVRILGIDRRVFMLLENERRILRNVNIFYCPRLLVLGCRSWMDLMLSRIPIPNSHILVHATQFLTFLSCYKHEKLISFLLIDTSRYLLPNPPTPRVAQGGALVLPFIVRSLLRYLAIFD